MVPAPLEQLIKQLSRLPGLGPRSAQRAALHLLTTQEALPQLQRIMLEVSNTVVTCSTCGNVSLEDPCHICTDEERDGRIICVVEQVDDLWAIERSGSYKGLYHVLGGVVNALDGIGPDDLNIRQLVERVENPDTQIEEVIFALGASVDGQTTCHLLSQRLEPTGVTITGLAKGIPVGASVDYLDDGTLAVALEGRKVFG
ncbi:MAG: recombination mediator RecR [Alphaproteobacteria bacterium]|nr:recombination mediator RecR [Alphaproteobacteria bacterium]MDD9919926.1 recombination mediator RecR [Alphaproteobacteria bacterium]